MWTNTADGDDVVREISRQLVSQFAPEELEVFDELYDEYKNDPSPPQRGKQKDEALGSGLGDVIVAFTPAASAMATAVVAFLVSEVLKASQEEASEKIRAAVKAVFNPKAGGKASPLSAEQLEKVRKLATRRAVEFGLSTEQAKQMSLALIGSLSIQ